MTIILLHQGGVGPEHQLYLTGPTVIHRVPTPILCCIVHVEATVITGLGAFNAGTCLLDTRAGRFRQRESITATVFDILPILTTLKLSLFIQLQITK